MTEFKDKADATAEKKPSTDAMPTSIHEEVKASAPRTDIPSLNLGAENLRNKTAQSLKLGLKN